MKQLKYVLAVGVCLGLFVYFFRDVTELDVVAANQFTMPAPAELIEAGDVVVQLDSGQISRICDAELTGPVQDDLSPSGVYYNRVDRILSGLVRASAHASFIDPEWLASLFDPQDFHFRGRYTTLPSAPVLYANPTKCPCEIARTLSRGQRACNVNAALVQTAKVWRDDTGDVGVEPGSRSLAVSLGVNVTWLPEKTFEACEVPFNDAAKAAMQLGCETASELSKDVLLRKRLNLIAREPYLEPEQEVAASFEG